MSTYHVILETRAELDLYDIFDYIGDTLAAPQAARHIFTALRDGVLSLSEEPQRCPFIADPYYAHLGIQKLFIENYVIFFRVHETEKEVHVLRILYARRNWKKLL